MYCLHYSLFDNKHQTVNVYGKLYIVINKNKTNTVKLFDYKINRFLEAIFILSLVILLFSLTIGVCIMNGLFLFNIYRLAKII